MYPFIENTVDPDQLASSEASWSGSTLFTTLLIITGMLQANRIKIGKECSTIHKNIQYDMS